MKNIIYSILAITFCLMLGKLTAYVVGGLPSSLYGLMLFTVLLHFKVLSAERIKLTIEWAISNMSVCFVPAGAGIIEHFDLIQHHGVSIVFIIFITTFILISIIGFLFEKSIENKNQPQKLNKTSPHK